MTYYAVPPTPFIVFGLMRSGTSMLMHALDSHIEIGAEREEIFNPSSSWQQYLGDAGQVQLLGAIFNRHGYKASGAKILYGQWTPPADYVNALRIRMIITYRNPIAAAFSWQMARAKQEWHTYDIQPLDTHYTFHVDSTVEYARTYVRWIKEIQEIARQYEHMVMYRYRDFVPANNMITALPTKIALELCKFLQVDGSQYLLVNTSRVTPKPEVMVANYNHIMEEMQADPVVSPYIKEFKT